jgi:hypothetical protein
MIRPSPPCAAATMPSADFCPFIPTPLDVGSHIGKRTDLPGYCAPSFPPYTRRIYSRTFRMTIGLRIFGPSRPDAVASYALRVPRAGGLPAASFRPRLAAEALAVQLTVPVIRVRRGLPPPRRCALPGAPIEQEGGTMAPFLYWIPISESLLKGSVQGLPLEGDLFQSFVDLLSYNLR